MYFYASLFAAFIVTLIVVSRVAEMLHAKRYSMKWIFIASLVGGIAASLLSVLLSVFVEGIDPMVMLISSLVAVFIVSSAAFKYINKMTWSGAITTNIANIAVGLIGLTAAVVLNGKSLNDTLDMVNITAQNKVSKVKTVATDVQSGKTVLESMTEIKVQQEITEENEAALVEEESNFDEIEKKVTERDLILPSALNEIKKKEKKVYVEAKYHVISIGSIRSLVGQPIRILNTSGNVIAGSLKKINGSDAYVAQRLKSGVATTPISIAKIRKLEVYR